MQCRKTPLADALARKMTRISIQKSAIEMQAATVILNHWRLLGHAGFGVTELRVFDPVPLVAYADNEDEAVRLCLEMEGKTSGIYIGVQPRPVHLFDLAPNCWRQARGRPNSNCASDGDIEYVTALFFDIDVVSAERANGHAASDEELAQTLRAAQLLGQEDGLAVSSTVCCSGNGHYVLAPVVPVPVSGNEVARQFKKLCLQFAEKAGPQVPGAKIDPVFNLSRVMRVIGTKNRKGTAVCGRPHRRAYFVTEPVAVRSMALYYMVLETDVGKPLNASQILPAAIKCDLTKLEGCAFVKYCRAAAEQVSQPQWFAMITNLAPLEGGPRLIHEISALDKRRYDYQDTERLIRRVIDAGYRPVCCQTLISEALICSGRGKFHCPEINRCPAKAPMYLAAVRTVYEI